MNGEAWGGSGVTSTVATLQGIQDAYEWAGGTNPNAVNWNSGYLGQAYNPIAYFTFMQIGQYIYRVNTYTGQAWRNDTSQSDPIWEPINEKGV